MSSIIKITRKNDFVWRTLNMIRDNIRLIFLNFKCLIETFKILSELFSSKFLVQILIKDLSDIIEPYCI